MKKSRIDKLGRIVIPIDYRKRLGLGEGSEIDIEYADEKVIISAANPLCRICGEGISEDSEFPLCKACIDRIKSAK